MRWLRHTSKRPSTYAVEVPSLKKALRNKKLPNPLVVVGTALLSIEPKGQFDLTGRKAGARLFLHQGTPLYLSAGLASLSLLVCGLFCADYYFKDEPSSFSRLNLPESTRLSFPKSPAGT